MSDPLLRISGLSFSYGSQPVLNDIGLSLFPGESLALAGPNGSGKTTLFRCMTGLEKFQEGAISLFGENVVTEKDFQKLRRKVGYSLQNAEDQLIFPTVLEDVSFGPLNLGFSEIRAEEMANACLARLGIAKHGKRLTHELSGGQQKLVALAAVLVMEPAVLLLDEPFNALDAAACQRVCELLASLPCAKIIVSHEQEYLGRLCSRALKLEDGRIVSAKAQ